MLADEKTNLDILIDSGKPILVIEVAPPDGTDLEAVRSCARRYADRVHALGVSDNRDGVRMSALAAASTIASEGVEPIQHLVRVGSRRVGLRRPRISDDAVGGSDDAVGDQVLPVGHREQRGPTDLQR